jgi:hypothetical protein
VDRTSGVLAVEDVVEGELSLGLVWWWGRRVSGRGTVLVDTVAEVDVFCAGAFVLGVRVP